MKLGKPTGFQPVSEVARNVLDMAIQHFGKGTSPGSAIHSQAGGVCKFWKVKGRTCLLPASEREGLYRCQWHAYLEVCPVLEARAGGGTLEQFTAWLDEYKPYETKKRPSDLWDLANVSG